MSKTICRKFEKKCVVQYMYNSAKKNNEHCQMRTSVKNGAKPTYPRRRPPAFPA